MSWFRRSRSHRPEPPVALPETEAPQPGERWVSQRVDGTWERFTVYGEDEVEPSWKPMPGSVVYRDTEPSYPVPPVAKCDGCGATTRGWDCGYCGRPREGGERLVCTGVTRTRHVYRGGEHVLTETKKAIAGVSGLPSAFVETAEEAEAIARKTLLESYVWERRYRGEEAELRKAGWK